MSPSLAPNVPVAPQTASSGALAPPIEPLRDDPLFNIRKIYNRQSGGSNDANNAVPFNVPSAGVESSTTASDALSGYDFEGDDANDNVMKSRRESLSGSVDTYSDDDVDDDDDDDDDNENNVKVSFDMKLTDGVSPRGASPAATFTDSASAGSAAAHVLTKNVVAPTSAASASGSISAAPAPAAAFTSVISASDGVTYRAPDGTEFQTKASWRTYMMNKYYSFTGLVGPSATPAIKSPGEVRGQVFEMNRCRDISLVVMDYCELAAIEQLTSCRVFIGACVTTVSIRQCTDCTFFVCCRQIRLRNSSNCAIYSFASSEMHMEQSEGIRVAPFRGGYPEHSLHLRAASIDLAGKNRWCDVVDHSAGPGGARPRWSAVLDESVWEPAWYPGLICEDVVYKPSTSWPLIKTLPPPPNRPPPRPPSRQPTPPTPHVPLSVSALDAPRDVNTTPPPDSPLADSSTSGDADSSVRTLDHDDASTLPTAEAFGGSRGGVVTASSSLVIDTKSSSSQSHQSESLNNDLVIDVISYSNQSHAPLPLQKDSSSRTSLTANYHRTSTSPVTLPVLSVDVSDSAGLIEFEFRDEPGGSPPAPGGHPTSPAKVKGDNSSPGKSAISPGKSPIPEERLLLSPRSPQSPGIHRFDAVSPTHSDVPLPAAGHSSHHHDPSADASQPSVLEPSLPDAGHSAPHSSSSLQTSLSAPSLSPSTLQVSTRSRTPTYVTIIYFLCLAAFGAIYYAAAGFY